MKIKKVIGIIVAANFVAGIGAFAQDADKSEAGQSGQAETLDSSVQTPPTLPAIEDPAGAATETFDKKEFLKEAAQSGVAEVNMAQIGTQKAQDPALKEVAQKLVTDHSQLNDQLKELAQKEGVTLSTEVDSKHQKMIDHLSGLSGSEFDKAFASHMAQGHKKSIAKYKKAAANTEDTEVSDLAKAALPKLQEHLAMIQKCAPDATAGTSIDEAAGADKKSDKHKDDTDNSRPDYQSPSDPK